MAGGIDRRGFLRQSAVLPFLSGMGIAGEEAAVPTVAAAGRMKTSICAYSFRKYLPQGKEKGSMTLEDFLETASRLGADGVELTFYYFSNYPQRCEDEFLYQIKRKAFLAGLEINGTAVGNDFCVAEPDQLVEEIRRVKTWIECASKLGSPEMRVFGGTVPKGGEEKECVEQAVKAFQECCQHGEKYGVMLALENHGGICTTAQQVIRIIQGVDSEWMGANLDTGNFVSEDPYQEIALLAPYALTCHVKVKVNRKTGERVDMTQVVEILRKANYKGYLPIEYEEEEDPPTGVPKLLKEIKAAIG